MLSKKLYFIHNFDEKMHYSIYYSLLKIQDHDGIYINDSVQNKKCNRKLGRWNFILAEEDYSCGIYYALEIIRQSIFSAMKKNKNSVDIALVSSKSDSDVCYLYNYEKEFENIEKYNNNQNCECNKKISKRIFFKVIKPVLEEMFKKSDYQITTNVFKDKILSERFGKFFINFLDLNILHIEWCADNVFNDLMDQKATEMELQLTAR